jgi:DNA (cytosine-5)-methyltransferase 1
MEQIRTLDLFAGAGGLTLGFKQADLGFEPVYAVEIDPAAARTFKRNFQCPVYDGPIEDIDQFESADVIIGGPPCQGFSPLGRDRDDDSRAHLNELWQHYLRAVRQVRPLAFVIENVLEFQKSTQFARLCQLLDTDPDFADYKYNFGVLNAADYGVPQRRRRGILVAARGVAEVPWPPPATHSGEPDAPVPWTTVREAIQGLPLYPKSDGITVDDEGRQDLHFRRNPRPSSLERYKAIPEGGNRFHLARKRPDLLPDCWANKPTGTTDVMGRLWWDKPSFTIRTEFYKPEKGRYLHPSAHRPITHREAARLQSFPDDFEFEGTKIQVARQIGNAVPPDLGTEIAKFVHALIKDQLRPKRKSSAVSSRQAPGRSGRPSSTRRTTAQR